MIRRWIPAFAGMTKRGSGNKVAAVAFVALAACHSAPAPTPATTAHPTIVSLNPCSDAILAEVTAPGQLLAISHFSRDPRSSSMDVARARSLPATGGTVEEIARLAPDMVVADSFLPPATAQALRDLGVRVETATSPTTVAQSQAQVRHLAAIAGEPRRGDALVARIDAAVRRAAPPPGAQVPALVWEAGGIVAGDGTLIADLLAHAGFVNAAAARGLSQADFLPLERVLADPPRMIFAVGDPASEEDRSLRHPALAALRNTRRVPLDGSLLWCGGPTIPRALDWLAKARAGLSDAIHPSPEGVGL